MLSYLLEMIAKTMKKRLKLRQLSLNSRLSYAMLVGLLPICLVSPLSFVSLLPSSPQISEEIVNRHSPLTGRRTCGAAPGLIKFEIVVMISGAATHSASLPPLPSLCPCYYPSVRAVWQVERRLCERKNVLFCVWLWLIVPHPFLVSLPLSIDRLSRKLRFLSFFSSSELWVYANKMAFTDWKINDFNNRLITHQAKGQTFAGSSF